MSWEPEENDDLTTVEWLEVETKLGTARVHFKPDWDHDRRVAFVKATIEGAEAMS